MELLVVGGDKRHAALCELARARGWHVMSMGLPGSLPCAGLADAAVLPMPYASMFSASSAPPQYTRAPGLTCSNTDTISGASLNSGAGTRPSLA